MEGRLALVFGLVCLVAHPMDAGETRDNAVFSLAQARGRLFVGSRAGEIAVFSRWSRAEREARALVARRESVSTTGL